MTYLKRIVIEWNVCRVVRIAGGIPIMVMGIQQQHWPTIVFGAAFVSLGLFTTQCCSGNACNTSIEKHKKIDLANTTEFEEIKNN
ncbi:MAG: hypothetical protein ACKVOW_09755 [Chitinophagaceae bacterium]